MLQRIRHRAQGQEGFTLVELLVVILIIGILAAIAIPTFLNQKSKASDASAKAAVRTAQTAQETYFTDHQSYTSTASDLVAIESTLNDATSLAAVAPPLSSTAAIYGATLVSTPTASASNSYVVSADSDSGVHYSIIRQSDGTVERRCNVPSGVSPGGCTPDSGTSGNGDW